MIQSTIAKRLTTLIEQRREKVRVALSADLQTELPPFHALAAALTMRLNTWRTMFLITTAILAVVIVFQQRIIFHKLFQKMNETVVIVPGSPEFFRVRPGQIPDESVFLFAEFIAANVGTFSYRNVTYHFGKIMQHMHPIARGRFELSFEQRLKDWLSRKVDQTFAYEPVRRYDLVHDGHGAKYLASVEGTLVQYVEGHAFSETRSVLLLEFRASGNLTPEKPFIFEIENLEWLTPEQYEARKRAKPPEDTTQAGESP